MNSTKELRELSRKLGETTEAGRALAIAAARINDLTAERDWCRSRSEREERRAAKLSAELRALKKSIGGGK